MSAAAAHSTSTFRLGAPIAVRNLTVTPIYAERVAPLDYLLLDEALARGDAETTEVSEAGSVPELLFRNRADLPVLLLDGEELAGAKQNRVLNMTILAPARADTVIPVSCIEMGRWSFNSRAFRTTARAQHSRGRAMKMMSVSASLARNVGARSDQGQVWGEISRKAAAMRVSSATAALSDVFDGHSERIEEIAVAVDFPGDAVGAVFSVNGAPLGAEIFDRPAVCQRLIGKVIRSWSLDALEDAEAPSRPAGVSVEALLQRMSEAPTQRYGGAGLGEHLRFDDGVVAGGALRVGDVPIHEVAFVRQYAEEHAPASGDAPLFTQTLRRRRAAQPTSEFERTVAKIAERLRREADNRRNRDDAPETA